MQAKKDTRIKGKMRGILFSNFVLYFSLSASLGFYLPPEIREMIWDYVQNFYPSEWNTTLLIKPKGSKSPPYILSVPSNTYFVELENFLCTLEGVKVSLGFHHYSVPFFKYLTMEQIPGKFYADWTVDLKFGEKCPDCGREGGFFNHSVFFSKDREEDTSYRLDDGPPGELSRCCGVWKCQSCWKNYLDRDAMIVLCEIWIKGGPIRKTM